jgi:hypothetical protein
VYKIHLTNHKSCDSLINLSLQLTKNNTTIIIHNDTLIASDTLGTINWYSCDSNKIVGNGNLFTVAQSGNYAAIISNNGCVDTTLCSHVSSVGVNNVTYENSWISLSPNPALGNIKIELINQQSSILLIEITDLLGRQISIVNVQDKTYYILERKNIISGIYFIKITNQERKSIIKKICWQ